MADNDVKLRADISLSVYPGTLAPLAKVMEASPETKHIYGQARFALEAMYKSLGAMSDASKAVYRALPPDAAAKGFEKVMVKGRPLPVILSGREAELRAAMHDSFDRASRAADHYRKVMLVGRDKIAATVEALITNPNAKTPSGIAAAQEIRQHFKSLDVKTRREAIDDAIRESDIEVVGALLSAKPFLSGLSRAQHDLLRTQAVLTFAPSESKMLEAANKAISTVEAAGSVFVESYGKLLPPSPKGSAKGAADTAIESLRKEA